MIDMKQAREAFKEYMINFDITNKRIRLKLIHTYKVIDLVNYICINEGHSDDDIQLALLIALLHDIGRFEQLKKYNSFDDNKFDHAKFGVKVLFEDGLIRNFISDDSYDNYIKLAISFHSSFKVPKFKDDRLNLHINIIRDADKLDNFRVKNVEEIETLFDISEIELGKEDISNTIMKSIRDNELILNRNRETHMDMWVSYLAFIFDFNFNASYKYIKEQDYVKRNIHRINYFNENTKKMMKEIEEILLKYIEEKLY